MVYYFARAVNFDIDHELIGVGDIILLTAGFLLGFIFAIAIAFVYFFRADVTISRRMPDTPPEVQDTGTKTGQHIALTSGGSRLIKVTSYLNSPLTVKPVRDVSHYPAAFIEAVFNRHHFAAVLSIFIAFLFLIGIGFFLDNPVFQLPAAASVTIFFSILVAVAGRIFILPARLEFAVSCCADCCA